MKYDIAINSDLKDFIPELFNECNKLNTEEWVKKCKEYNNRFSFENTKEYNTKNKKINPYYFVHKLTSLMKENDIMAVGNGSACTIAYQAGEVKKGQRIFWNKGSASMGYGLPASIGACIYNNKNKIICLDGDGSIMMNIQELQTIKHYNLPIKIFILNNDGYISIKQTQNNFFEGHMVGSGRDSGVSMPDFNKVADAFRIDSVKISDYTDDTDLERQINAVLESKEAVICNVILEDDYIFIHFAWDGVNREEIDSEYIQKNNVELSLICLKFAYDIGCKLFISSGSRSEYGDINGIVNENTDYNPISEYGKAKLKFCNEAKYFSDKMDIKVLHIRIFSVYGINDHPWSLINSLIDNLYKNTDMKLG